MSKVLDTQVTITTEIATQSMLSGYIPTSEKGATNGVAPLNGTGVVETTHGGTGANGFIADRAVQSDNAGDLQSSTVTSVELGRLSGITSNVQTQLNAKMINPMTTGGDMIYAGAGSGIVLVGTEATGTAPFQGTISPDGAFAYVVNTSGTTVSQYSIVAGLLVPLGTPTVATGATPYHIAISADGLSAYVANLDDASISQYSRNVSTGLLTPLSPATVSTGAIPVQVCVSTDGTSVYATSNGDNAVYQFSRDTGTGLLTPLSPASVSAGAAAHAIAISPDNTSVYVANNGDSTVSMFSRDTGTGLLTALGTPFIASGTNPQGIIVSSDSSFVYASCRTDSVVYAYSRNTGTGALTFLSSTAVGDAPIGLALTPDGALLFTANNASTNMSVLDRNTSTGLLVPAGVATVATGAAPTYVMVGTAGTFAYVINQGDSNVGEYSVAAITPITVERLPNGTAGQFLKSNGGTAAPSWSALPGPNNVIVTDTNHVAGPTDENIFAQTTTVSDIDITLPDPTTAVHSRVSVINTCTALSLGSIKVMSTYLSPSLLLSYPAGFSISVPGTGMNFVSDRAYWHITQIF